MLTADIIEIVQKKKLLIILITIIPYCFVFVHVMVP